MFTVACLSQVFLCSPFCSPRLSAAGAMTGSPERVRWGWDLSSRPAPRVKDKGKKRAAAASSSSQPSSSHLPPPQAREAPALSAGEGVQNPRAAPPLRSDAPGRNVRRRGELPALTSTEDRALALASFHTDVYAATTLKAAKHKMATVTAALGKWEFAPLPPDREKIAALGAALKAGGYRSAPSYLTAYRGHIERGGYSISGPLQRAFRDAQRSCVRGLGGPVRARALPLDQLASLPGGPRAWAKGGPIHPRNAIVVGAWSSTSKSSTSRSSTSRSRSGSSTSRIST